jgi:pyridoxamine 5'-phosphate oxidase
MNSDPLELFHAWIHGDRMAIATATPDGRPSVRMLLLKSADERGFTFFTSYESRKWRELEANPRAALLFHWQPLGRQVRVEGRVARIAADESEAYFVTRPLESRLAAWASPQSRTLASRDELERLYRDAEERFPGAEVPLPPHWGGFRLEPDTYEFWQHGDDRLHDRVRYERADGAWQRVRLAP